MVASQDADEGASMGAAADNFAFRTFYQSHYEKVLKYALRRAGPEDARDITSEVFIVAWRRFEVASLGGLPWLYKTAALVLANSRRSERRLRVVECRLGMSAPPSDDADHADRYVERERVRQAIRELPHSEQEIIMLTIWEDLDVKTAATVIGCSSGAAHVRLHRARRRLAKILGNIS